MPDPETREEEIHLPQPTAAPLVLSLGIALVLGGLVPDEILLRLSLISIGFVIALAAGWVWLRLAIADYRHLH
jgi:hypothetical protein